MELNVPGHNLRPLETATKEALTVMAKPKLIVMDNGPEAAAAGHRRTTGADETTVTT
jgi:hypothetical protein